MKRALLALTLLLSGCGSRLPDLALEGSQSVAGGLSLAERLGAEAGRLSQLFRLDALLQLGVLIGVMLLLQRGVTIAVRIAWRLGLDADRRLGWWANASRVFFGLVVLYFVGRRMALAAPIIVSFAFVVLLLSAAWVLSSHLQNALVGVGLVLRQRVRSGDRIQVGEHVGIVQEVGINHLLLRRADGSTLFVPNRMLNDGVLTVAREKNSVPVKMRLVLPARAAREHLERARRVALLCPYRAPGSSVEVSRDPANECAIVIVVQAWAQQSARFAAEHMDASLRAALHDALQPRGEKKVA